MQNVQFITDEVGNKTAVVLPIKEWESIKLELEYGIPEWHKEVVDERTNELSEPGKSWEEVKANLIRKN